MVVITSIRGDRIAVILIGRIMLNNKGVTNKKWQSCSGRLYNPIIRKAQLDFNI